MDYVAIAIVAIVCTIGLPVVLGVVLGSQLVKSRHAERMEMIRKGFILEVPEKKPNRYPALRNGLFMIALAIGILVGVLLGPVMPVADGWMDLTIPTMALLFGGLSFIVYFFISRIIQEKEIEKDNKSQY